MFLCASASLPKTFKAKSQPPAKSQTPIAQRQRPNAKTTTAKAQNRNPARKAQSEIQKHNVKTFDRESFAERLSPESTSKKQGLNILLFCGSASLPKTTKAKSQTPAKSPTPKAQRQMPNAAAQREKLKAKDKSVTSKYLTESLSQNSSLQRVHQRNKD